MYSNRTIGVLTILLTLFVGLIFARSFLGQQSSQIDPQYLSAVSGLSRENINSISFELNEDDIQIQKINEEWRIGEYRADANSISELIQTVSSPQELSIVAETDLRHDALGVGQSGVKVRFSNSEDQWEMIIGNRSTSGHYIRFTNQPFVYLIPVLPVNQDMKLADWIDLNLARIPRDNIQGITIDHHGTALSLEQHDEDWFVSGNTNALDNSSLFSLLSSLESLRANKVILPDTEDASLAFPETASTTITVATDDETILFSFYPGSEDVKVTTNHRHGEFIINQTTYETIILTEEELIFSDDLNNTDE